MSNAKEEADELAASLLAPGAPALARCEALEDEGAPGVRVWLAARHAVVHEVLCDDTTFSLRLYDELLEMVAGSARYFVGEYTPGRARRLAMLMAAQRHLAEERGAEPGAMPNLAAEYRAWIARLTRHEARSVLKVLAPRGRTGEPVNLVREYAMLVAYRVTRQVVGIDGPRTPPLFARLVTFARNVLGKGRWIRLTGELGASTSLSAMLMPLFGLVFGTIARPVPLLVTATRATTPALLADIEARIAAPEAAPAGSLVRAFAAVRGQFPETSDADYADDARSVLFELAGALFMIVSKALSDCFGLAAGPGGVAAGLDWPGAIAHLTDPTADQAHRDAVVQEMMRLSARGGQLVRTVAADTTFHGIALAAGDRVVVRIGEASMDPAAFPDPARFAPDPARVYLTNGPFDGPHVCYGRAIAWTVIAEALVEASHVLEPAAGAVLTTFAGLPDDMPWQVIPSRAEGSAR